jgi:quercetin dioxygenase-like cupin family protein
VTAVRVMTHAELMTSANAPLPGSDTVGTRRTAYKGLVAGTFKVNLVVMPQGQRSPARESEIEHIIYVVEGSFEFDVEGVAYDVAARDQIFVPVGVHWEYRNTFAGQSTFLSVTGP